MRRFAGSGTIHDVYMQKLLCADTDILRYANAVRCMFDYLQFLASEAPHGAGGLPPAASPPAVEGGAGLGWLAPGTLFPTPSRTPALGSPLPRSLARSLAPRLRSRQRRG